MNDFFNLKRLELFLRSDLAVRARSILTFTITTFVVLFLYNILSAEYMPGFHNVLYSLFLFGGGFFITSHVFSDLHDKTQGVVFLTLPASQFEKLLGRWLITAVGYALGLLLLFSILFIFTNLCKAIFIPSFRSITVFHINWQQILQSLKYYLLLQPVFLLGAIYFKKSALTKTILCWGLFALLLFFVKSLLVAVFFIQDVTLQRVVDWQNYGLFAVNAFLLILAPASLLITYLRLRESEI